MAPPQQAALKQLVLQLLAYDSARRLRCARPPGAVAGPWAFGSHPFFAGLDWEALAHRRLEPPIDPTAARNCN